MYRVPSTSFPNIALCLYRIFQNCHNYQGWKTIKISKQKWSWRLQFTRHTGKNGGGRVLFIALQWNNYSINFLIPAFGQFSIVCSILQPMSLEKWEISGNIADWPHSAWNAMRTHIWSFRLNVFFLQEIWSHVSHVPSGRKCEQIGDVWVKYLCWQNQ